jgi:sigma-E factor negative regulatory protein RseB
MRFDSILLGVLICSNAVAADSDTAIELLRNMHKSSGTLSYRGTFIYSHNGKMDSMQIFHRAGAKGERERVVHLNGTPREVIRDNNIITCILPDSKAVSVSKYDATQHSVLTQLPADMAQFRQYYDFAIAGQDRIAGRPTIVVRIDPKDKFRYGYRFWLDAQHSLLLKSEMIGEDGAVAEQVMFTSLELLPDIPDEQLKPSLRGVHLTSMASGADNVTTLDAGTVRWQVTRMPDGFKAAGDKARVMEGDGGMVHHIVLSDGLASVSVYVEKRDPQKKHFVGSSFMGAVNVYGVVVDEHQVTAVGEVPTATVKMVAESIQFAGAR